VKKEELRIVFLGNPEFAKYHLDYFVKDGYQIVGVVSAPDKAAGRGMRISTTPVTDYAREHNIPLLQPSNLKDADFQRELKALNADIQVVIAFRMLPVSVWDMPPMGTVNLHASLLPNYRGAAPINWAIINGEQETGVTSFKLKHEIDTGDILLQKSCPITPEDTAGSLHDKLMHMGALVMQETLEGLLDGSLEEIPQVATAELRNAPKLYSKDCLINWEEDGQQIINKIRGLNPYPVAHTQLKGKRLRIFEAEFVPAKVEGASGELKTDGKTELAFSCANGYIQLHSLQMEGKKRMDVGSFLRGFDPR
jgi:methionyl-tRNA formyltransferase